MRNTVLAALVLVLVLGVSPAARAKPAGDALMRLAMPAARSTASAHPHVNVVVLFGTTPDGAAPDPATFRARVNGTDVTDRFVPLAASEFGGTTGLRAALGDGVLRIDANNKLKLRIRSLPVTLGGRARRLKDKERVRFFVDARANQPPDARASADSDVIFPGVPVAFDASASSDPEGDPLAWTWDFGDGTTATGPTAEHAYTAGTGDLVVTVSVSDGAAAATRTLPLAAEPTVDPGRTKGLLALAADERLEFGGVPVGQDGARTFTVTNADPAPTSQLVVRISAPEGPFTATPGTLVLDPEESGTVTVRFAPSAPGHADAIVSLVASAANRAAVNLVAHGFGGAASGSGPSLAAAPAYYTGPHDTLPGIGVFALRPDGARVPVDNAVRGCTVPGSGIGTDDACVTDADCAVHGGTCDPARTLLFDPEDLCADAGGTLVVLGTDGVVTDPDFDAETSKSSALLRISLDADGDATEKSLLARVTGDTTQLACDDTAAGARGRVYVAEYFDVDSGTCSRTEREALVSVRKDNGGTNGLVSRLDSIQGLDGCDDLEDATAALATRGGGDPLYVSFDFGGIWRFDAPDAHRAIVTGTSGVGAVDVHPDGAVVFAVAVDEGTRTAIRLYKVSPERAAAGPLVFAALTPCAVHLLPDNGGRLAATALAIETSAADPNVAVALVATRASGGALLDVLPPALAAQGAVAFTVPAGDADACSATGLVTLDALDLLSF